MHRRPTVSKYPEVAKRLSVRLMVFEFYQDDPKKCTSARLRKFRIVKRLPSLKSIPHHAVVLNPIATQVLTRADRELVDRNGIVALDCSWNRSEEIFERRAPGENRRLPTLLAGNSTNYGVAGKLSTAEAFAAALFITGFKEQARRVLSHFNWGETFTALNRELLREYSRSGPGEVLEREVEFFGLQRG